MKVLRRLAHLSFLATRPMTLGVRGVAIDPERGVMLVRHTYVPGWHLPGGGVEAGETALAALKREMREETNIESDGDADLLGLYHNSFASRRDHVIVYVLRAFKTLGARPPDREIAEAAFFPLERLPHDVARATRDRLAEAAGRRPLSETW